MILVKTWRGKPDIMEEDIKSSQEFGNMLGGFIGMFLVFAVGMFFYEGCSWRSVNGPDNIVTPAEEETAPDPSFNASDWILFK